MNRILGLIAAAMVIVVSSLAAWAFIRYLPNHSQSSTMALGILVGGLLVAVLLYAIIRRLPDRRRVRVVVVALLGLLLLVPVLSMFLMGRITYATFGMTVYGLIPVPALDITVDSRGVLWFRAKSHRLSLEEVEPLLTPEVEVIVIGTGWQNLVQVDEAVRRLPGREVKILPTPEAFACFNSLVAQGRRVVLLAHSTC